MVVSFNLRAEWGIHMKPHFWGLLLSLTLLSCTDKHAPQVIELSGYAQGTTYHIKLAHDPGTNQLEQIRLQVTAVLDQIDSQMSNFRQDSEISRLNAQETTQWLSVSPEIMQLLTIAQIVYQRSGGEMFVKGRKANGDNWRIGVETPIAGERGLQKVIQIHEPQGTAVMTAGTYRNYFVDHGQQYSHILSPQTGKPVNHQLRSVTVVHDDPTWADAWDTALLCVGEAKARQIAEEEHLKVLLIYEHDKKLYEYASKAFEASQ